MSKAPRARAGFVRYELYLLLALVLVAAAVVVPHLVRDEVLGSLAALGILLGVVAAGVGVLYLVAWLAGAVAEAGWSDRIARGLGHLLRFALGAVIGMFVVTALVANHQKGPRAENLGALVGGLLGGAAGTLLYLKLGKERYWRGFAWFALALLGSLAGGILGILLPEPWDIDLGVMAQLALFVVLVLVVRARSRRQSAAS